MATERGKKTRLFDGLDPLSCHCEAKRAAEFHNRAHDNRALARHLHRLQKRTVDLDLVEGKTPQIDQARIAAAEIVKRHGEALGAKVDHRTLGKLEVGDEDPSGEFKRHALWFEIGLGYEPLNR